MQSLVQQLDRHGSAESYTLVSGDNLAKSKPVLARIVSCCNEPAIYGSLFTKLCGGEPYTTNHAEHWVDWMHNGWKDQSHFCFVALDSQSLPVASCDLKSADITDCEIGYWCSELAHGVMTNSVNAMLQHATNSKFFGFHAFVRHDNERSQQLLDRVGFHPDDSRDEDELIMYTYSSLRDGDSLAR